MTTDDTSATRDLSDRVWDVVVVGAGNAALCAALSAREHGAQVLVLEAASRGERGGNSRFTDGATRIAYDDLDDLRALLPHLTDEDAARIDLEPYPAADYAKDLERMSGGRTDPTLAGLLAARSHGTLCWLRDHGVAYELIFDNQAVEEDGRHRFWGGLVLRSTGRGVGLMDSLFRRVEEAGVPVLYESPLTSLVLEDGTIRGVRVSGGDGPVVRCRSLVLACGGFEASAESRHRHLGAGWADVVVRGTPHNTGAGLEAALAVGAHSKGDWAGCHAVAMDAGAPPFGDFDIGGDVFKKHSYPYGIVINSEGRRFLDEGADFRNYTYARYGRALLDQPGGIAYQLFDAQVAHLLRSEYLGPHTTGYEAESLRELAGLIGVDADVLDSTVREYNAAVSEGAYVPHALDGKKAEGVVPPKSNWALRLEAPPFQAFPVRCGITFTFGGVSVDGSAAVLRADGEPIPGLYAAGEMIGGLFYDNYPGGSGLASGAVFGRIAGRSAAKSAAERA